MDDFFKSSKFKIGDEIQCISDLGRIGTVVEIGEIHAGIQWYRVNLGAAGRPKMPETDIRPFVSFKSPQENLIKHKLDGYQEFQRLITFQRLLREHPLQNIFSGFNASRIQFYPYQFKPLYKFLNSPKRRLLIADEVGLGKTIEAGLILTELRARQTLQKVLVVCPANLCEKWQMELRGKFDEKFKILTAKEFINLLQRFEEPSQNSAINGIISLESIRTKKMLKHLEGLGAFFDLVIVDEAHHMRNFKCNSHKVGILLNRRADAMLLLTATPIHLGSKNLFSLLNILDPVKFPDLPTLDKHIRENKPIVDAQICVEQIPPKIKKAEKLLRNVSGNSFINTRHIYAELMENFKNLKLTSKNGNKKRSLILQIQRGLAELNLIGDIFTRSKKKEVLPQRAVRKAFRIELSFNQTEKSFYDAVTNYVLTESKQNTGIQHWKLIMTQRRIASCLPVMVENYERHFNSNKNDSSYPERKLLAILKKWPKDAPDSKYNEFLKMLKSLKKKEGNLKIIVFAFFKDTLLYLKNRLTKDGFLCDIISGDVKPADRIAIVNKFRAEPSFEILLSSEVGSEGLDFQFCHTLFNYDLPWNPMEIEQRIGRIDRIGQKSSVIRIYNFWVKGTIEKRILDKLYERIGVFKQSIGELESILGDELRSFERDMLGKKLTREEEKRLIKQKWMAIKYREKESERLKEHSAEFIGTDQFFNLEVDRIKRRCQFITSGQMRKFITDFIKDNCPNSIFKYCQNRNLGYLYPDSVLGEIIKNNGISEKLLRFLANLDAETPITFDPQTAFDHPDYEFINVHHPLTRSIVKYYSESDKLNSNAHYVALKTNNLKKGLYTYFIFRLRIHAAVGGDTLQMVILDQNLNCVCNGEDAEIVLGEIIEKGKDTRDADYKIRSIPTPKKAYKRASKIFLKRVADIRKEIKKNNDVFIDRRLQNLSTFCGNHNMSVIIPRFKAVANDTALKNKEKENYIRILRGNMRIPGLEFEEKVRNLKKQRKLQLEYEDVSAGILKII
jgi:superfamily II DNA or RNA helicase